MQKISLLLAMTLLAASCGSSSSGNQIAFDRSSFDSRIAFLAGSYRSPEIFVMNPDGTDRCSGGPTAGAFSWSPDGSRIAFNRPDTDGSSYGEIFVMYADCTGIDSTGQKGYDLDWSPDGTKIVFADTRNHNLNFFPQVNPISVVTAGGSGVWSLRGSGCDPKWSPDGRWIAFVDQDVGEILVINSSSRNDRYIYKPIQGDFDCGFSFGDEKFSWSPDGSQIAWKDKNFTIFLRDMPFDSDGPFNLNRATGTGKYYPLTESWEDAMTGIPKWSPDGSQIAAWICCDGIVVMDTDGTSAYELINLSWEEGLRPSAIASACEMCWEILEDFSWSPDGSQIAFSSVGLTNNWDWLEIFVMNTDGTGLYSTGREGWNPKWSPNG